MTETFFKVAFEWQNLDLHFIFCGVTILILSVLVFFSPVFQVWFSVSTERTQSLLGNPSVD